MIFIIHYKQGNIILIPFPFTDFSTTKNRPAIIISSNAYNSTHDDIIICAITSQIPKNLEPYDYLLNASELLEATLPKKSLIKTDKILAIDKKFIRKTLGTLPQDSINKIINHLNHAFRD